MLINYGKSAYYECAYYEWAQYLFGDMLLLLGKGLIFQGVETIDVVFGGVVIFGEIIARDQFQRAAPNTDNVSDS